MRKEAGTKGMGQGGLGLVGCTANPCRMRVLRRDERPVSVDCGMRALPLCGTCWQGPLWRHCARPAWPGHTRARRVRDMRAHDVFSCAVDGRISTCYGVDAVRLVFSDIYHLCRVCLFSTNGTLSYLPVFMEFKCNGIT